MTRAEEALEKIIWEYVGVDYSDLQAAEKHVLDYAVRGLGSMLVLDQHNQVCHESLPVVRSPDLGKRDKGTTSQSVESGIMHTHGQVNTGCPDPNCAICKRELNVAIQVEVMRQEVEALMPSTLLEKYIPPAVKAIAKKIEEDLRELYRRFEAEAKESKAKSRTPTSGRTGRRRNRFSEK
jgi:hypothetical protein